MSQKSYQDFSLEEQLAVLKDYLPKLDQLSEAVELLKSIDERKEELNITHDVNLSDIEGEVTIKDSVEVNDLDRLIETVENLQQAFEKKKFDPTVNVKAPQVKVDLKDLKKTLKALVEKDVVVNVKKDKITFPTRAKDALPVKLVTSDGKAFYNASSGSSGGIGQLANVGVVESTDTPGVFGLVVVNADGSAVSGGGTTPTDNDNLLLESGDNLLLESGDQLLLQTA